MAEGEKNMSFWQKVKDGFAYGLGGSFGARIGWEVADFLVTWVRRILFVLFAGTTFGGLAMCSDFKQTLEKHVDQPAKTVKQQQNQNQQR